MVAFLDAAIIAFGIIFSWPVILFVIAGTLLGMLFGALPGLGGIVVLALLIPLTVGMDVNTTMALFGAALGGVAFGGSISAILINIPGTAPNAATLLDGYPMTQQGRGGEALGASATASALGAMFGLLVLVMVLPVARAVILQFASPEFFMLTLFGISVIAFVTRGGLLQGLAAGGLGLLFSFVGWDPLTGNVRFNLVEIAGFTTGANYLYDGVKLVPAVIGIFAISEVIYLLATKRETIADRGTYKAAGGVLAGVRSVFGHRLLLLRSSAIGTLVGIIPGVGGTVANFIAYLAASQSAKDPEQFGQGDVRGVIASEAANDAKDGGALLPTLVFGIPGSATTALIMSALILNGVAPGPGLLGDELEVVFSLIFALLIANLLTSVIGLSIAEQIAKITTIQTTYIIPVVIVVSLAGAYVASGTWGDVVMAVMLGILGVFMIVHNYSRIAFIIGLILGHTAEVNFHQSIRAYDAGGLVFFTRPISLILVIALVITFVYPLIRNARRRAAA